MESFPNTKKGNIVRFIVKHLQRGRHFTTIKTRSGNLGGRPQELYMLTDEAAKLVRDSWNLRHRYNPSLQQVTIMSLENQTIGFLHTALIGIATVVRQMPVERYKVDMVLRWPADTKERMLAVECDEMGHADRDPCNEATREDVLIARGFNVLRFNPNAEGFDLALVLNFILRLIFQHDAWDMQPRVIRF